MNKYILTSVLSVLYFTVEISAQIPNGYYDDAIGLTGDELKAALHNIIDDHTEYTYGDLRDFILPETDEDPINSSNVILIHSGISRNKDKFGGNVGDWNREHVWAKSHGDFGTTPPAGSDAHHIRPSDVQVNSTRGNLDFDNGGTPVNNCPGCKVDGNSFETRDDAKGDVARMIFYMAVRYEGDSGEPDLEVVDRVNTYPDPEHGKLSTLLVWHEQDPVDDFEMNRNEVIYSYQRNRNPFIDHPEFAEDIWGDPTSISNSLESVIGVYPNPAKNIINIEQELFRELKYSLINSNGQVLYQGVLMPGFSSIEISLLSPGIYALVLSDKNGKHFKHYKILKNIN